MKKSAVIGITGGIGSGKSTILELLKNEYDGFVIEADKVGHILMEPGNPAYTQIVDYFGKDILNPDNTINRKKLGNIVFVDNGKLDKLNSIIHPLVKKYISNFINETKSKNDCCLIFVEAALLIEDNYDEICDYLWYIFADKDIRFERINKSRNMTRTAFENIVNNQLSDDAFRNKCDVVIDNSFTSENTKEQIDRALESVWNGDGYGR